jgi:hypothetical protein
METLKSRGAEFTDTEPRPGAVGQVAFMHPGSTGGVLVEINQEIAEAPALADEATGPVATTDDGRPATEASPAAGGRSSASGPGSAVLEP